MTCLYADSTVAMSVYNTLAMTGGSTLDELLPSLIASVHPGLKIDQLRRSIDELVKRRLLVKAPVNSAGGAKILYSLVDAGRRVVVGRNREDIVEEDDGRWSGGWNFWVARLNNGTLASITEVAK